MLAGLAALIISIVGLIAPRWVRLRNRWIAFVLLGVGFILINAAGEYFPVHGARPEPGSTVSIAVGWAFWMAVFWGGVKLFRRKPRDRTAPAPAPAAPMGLSPDKIEERKRIGRDLQRKLENQRKQPGGGKRETPNLERAVSNLRVVPKTPPKRKARVSASVEESIPEPKRDHASGWAGFICYEDAKGEITERRIAVRRIEGYGKANAISAWCFERKAHRRFLVSGIRELICAETGEVLDAQSHFDKLAQQGVVESLDKSLADLVTILVFLARCDGHFHPNEQAAIDRAIQEHMMTFGGDAKQSKAAMKRALQLAPDGKDFMLALDRIGKHARRALLADLILDASEEVIEADGQTAGEEERWFDSVTAKLLEMAEPAIA